MGEHHPDAYTYGEPRGPGNPAPGSYAGRRPDMWGLIDGVIGISAGCFIALVIMVIRVSARLAVLRCHVTEAALDDAERAMYGMVRHDMAGRG